MNGRGEGAGILLSYVFSVATVLLCQIIMCLSKIGVCMGAQAPHLWCMHGKLVVGVVSVSNGLLSPLVENELSMVPKWVVKK